MTLLGPDGKPLAAAGVVLPNGAPAARSIEPGQDAAFGLVRGVAGMPDFVGVLDDIEAWRARQPQGTELSAGQRRMVQCVQMAARWQDEARKLIAKATPPPKEQPPEQA